MWGGDRTGGRITGARVPCQGVNGLAVVLKQPESSVGVFADILDRLLLTWDAFLSFFLTASPHNSVSETSFYKHIDCDLPDSERLRQLLIWCSIRASGTTTFSSSSTPSKPKSLPANIQLPKLSAKANQVFRSFQDDVVRMLAERKIDLSLYGGPDTSQAGPSEVKLRENEQNSKNKEFEVKYSQEIRR